MLWTQLIGWVSFYLGVKGKKNPSPFELGWIGLLVRLYQSCVADEFWMSSAVRSIW